MSKLCQKCLEKEIRNKQKDIIEIIIRGLVKLHHNQKLFYTKDERKKTYWNKLLSCHKLKKIHFSCNTTSVHIWIRVWTEKPWNDAAHANRKLRHKYYTKFAIFHTWCNDSSLWSDSQNNGPVSSYIDKPHSSGKQLWFQIGSPAQQAFFLLTSRMAELGGSFWQIS